MNSSELHQTLLAMEKRWQTDIQLLQSLDPNGSWSTPLEYHLRLAVNALDLQQRERLLEFIETSLWLKPSGHEGDS